MNGLYVYSIMVGGSILALFIWISVATMFRFMDKAKIAFLFSAFMLWAVMMTGVYNPCFNRLSI